MSYMYHATNKANLVGIRDTGMAPASRRPPSTAMGATQKNRIDKHAKKRLDRFKSLLRTLAALGYSHDKILQSTVHVEITFSRDNFAVIDEFPYAPSTGTYGAIPENKGVIAAEADCKKIFDQYVAALKAAGVPTGDAMAQNKLSNAKPLPHTYKLINALDLSSYHDHFLSKLSHAYEELVADNEQEITRHRVYLFAEKQFQSEYASYATHIANGDYDALAILRVDLADVVSPMVDVSQGNAATTKETINAAQIQYKIGVPLASVQDGSVFKDGWNVLSSYVPPTATPIPSVASSSQGDSLDGGTI